MQKGEQYFMIAVGHRCPAFGDWRGQTSRNARSEPGSSRQARTRAHRSKRTESALGAGPRSPMCRARTAWRTVDRYAIPDRVSFHARRVWRQMKAGNRAVVLCGQKAHFAGYACVGPEPSCRRLIA